MKTRMDFVTNSSSSSFVIRKKDLTEKQIEQIKNHIEEAGKMIDFETYNDPWYIEEDEYIIKGSTIMDNFDMGEFLFRIGVKENISWRDY